MEVVDLFGSGELSKLVLEPVEGRKLHGFDVVEQRPEFLDVVLDGSACQQQDSLAG